MDNYFSKSAGKEIEHGITWFINLRWVASVILFAVTSTSYVIFGINLPIAYLYAGNAALVLCNFCCLSYKRILCNETNPEKWLQKANRFTNIQIVADLFILTYLIHFSSGIENPFIFYFIFHIVIASILLKNRLACTHAVLSVFLVGSLCAGEYYGLLAHHPLVGFMYENQYRNPLYCYGMFFVFSSTMLLTVYMAATIVNKLRKRDSDLELANEQIAENDRLKSRYVLTVSHDLQASLAAVQNCLRVVLDGITGQIPEKSHEMISRAESRIFNMLSFVKDLLDLSRLRSARGIDKTRLDFSALITDVISQVKPMADSKSISIETKVPATMPYIIANKDSIEKLLMNLLINGIKYTPKMGKVGLIVKVPREDGELFEVEVWDTGIGISLPDRERLFTEFFRAKNAEQIEKNGTGLGLSIVQEVVKAHNGSVWVESEIGKGSRFFFTLPR